MPEPKLSFAVAVAALITAAGVASAQSSSKADNTYPANFENVDIRTLAEAVAAASGKTLIIDPEVRGLFTMVSARPLSGSQLYAAFGQTMALKGYVVEDSRGIVKVYPGKPRT